MVATFVLVHGAGHGGWVWRKVVGPLRALGHEVYTPTLTGCGERSHLATPEVNLSTQIQDIINVLEYEGLEDLVLVGHSWAGLVISGVIDRLPHRLAHGIYLDGIVPEDGECRFDMTPGARESLGEAWLIPPPSPETFGVTDPVDVAWMTERLTPMPVASYTERLRLKNPGQTTVRHSYIHCRGYQLPAPLENIKIISVARARERGWPVYELEAPHDAMVTHPLELMEVVLMSLSREKGAH